MAKDGIHPTYHRGIEVKCICGHVYEVNSGVKGPVKIENCPNCHPLWTGKASTQVVQGRMEKFLEKQKKMEAIQKAA